MSSIAVAGNAPRGVPRRGRSVRWVSGMSSRSAKRMAATTWHGVAVRLLDSDRSVLERVVIFWGSVRGRSSLPAPQPGRAYHLAGSRRHPWQRARSAAAGPEGVSQLAGNCPVCSQKDAQMTAIMTMDQGREFSPRNCAASSAPENGKTPQTARDLPCVSPFGPSSPWSSGGLYWALWAWREVAGPRSHATSFACNDRMPFPQSIYLSWPADPRPGLLTALCGLPQPAGQSHAINSPPCRQKCQGAQESPI